MKSIGLALAVAILALTAGGCATITTGTTQAINVDSDPQGAECSLMRSGQPLATVTTPAPITIKRNQETIHVRCKKDGFEEGLVVMNSRFETRSAGNLILGGLVGIMVDASSGASSRYDSYVLIAMAPLSPADAVAAAVRPRPAPAPRPAEPASPPASAASVPASTVYGPGPWKARTSLMADRSAALCAKGGVVYSLDLSDDKLTADRAGDRVFQIPVPAEGAVTQTFKPLTGARLEMVGNARTRELELVDSTWGCRWKLTPE